VGNLTFKFLTTHRRNRIAVHLSQSENKRSAVFESTAPYKYFNEAELGFKYFSKPGVELSVKLHDNIIPISGSSVTLNVSAVEKDENISGKFSFVNKNLNGNVQAHVPLPQKLFDLTTDEAVESRIKVDGEFVARPFDDEDLYLGVHALYEVPMEHEQPHYDIRAVVATKNANFEGGIYGRKGNDRDEGDRAKIGVWATTEADDVVAGAQAEYDLAKEDEIYKGFAFSTFASFHTSRDQKVLASISIVPHTTLSVGFVNKIDTRTKISFGLAYVIAQGNKVKPEHFKQSAFSLGIELDH